MDYSKYTFKQMVDIWNKHKQEPNNDCNACHKNVANIIAIGDGLWADSEECYRCGMKHYVKPYKQKRGNNG